MRNGKNAGNIPKARSHLSWQVVTAAWISACSALGTALRRHHLLLFEYDNGGYMNTGYQLSYSTPMGAKSSTSHLGKTQYGKTFFHKDMPQIMAATHLPMWQPSPSRTHMILSKRLQKQLPMQGNSAPPM